MGRFFTLFFIILFGINNNIWGQVDTIAVQDFETTPAAPVLTYTTSGSGTSVLIGQLSGGLPSNSPYYVSGTRGFTRSAGSGTGTLTSSVTDVSAYTDISISFRLASLSTTTGNGAETGDYVSISISTDGGATWDEQSRITGTNNTCWAFTDGRSADRTYSTSAYTTFNPGYNNYSTPANGYSTVVVNAIPPTTQLQIRIVLANNSTNEIWAIDNIVITGIPADPAIINLSRSSASDFTYVFGAGPSAVDTFRISGDSLVPQNGYLGLKASSNYQISTSSGGPFSDSISVAYTDSTLTWTTIYARMVSGLSVGSHTGTVTVSGGDATNKTLNLSGTVTPGPCGDLIISEYVLGSSNNKYIEIYNPTSGTIQLNDGSTHFYRLTYYANGASSPTNTINLSSNASIPAYGTYVIGHSSGTIHSPNQTFGWAFNGDDAISLQKRVGATYQDIDVFGEIGVDPGTDWTVGGVSTLATTLVRRPEVQTGSPSQSGFPSLGTEWISYTNNEGHTLGAHASSCQNTNITYITGLSVSTICPGQTMTVDFTTTGTYNSGNIFTVQLSGSNGLFSSPVNIGTLSLSGTNPSGTINVTIPGGTTSSANYHLRIISSNPSSGTVISIQHLNVPSTTPPVVTGPATTQENNATTLSWTNPSSGCWEEVMAVISTTPSFTFTPTGNGSLYTANPVYGSGNQVIYKGTGNAVNITGLTNGTIYYIKIFTRNGTTWSSAVEHEILVDPYCHPKYNYYPISPSAGSCDEYISNVTLETINNTTAPGCGFNGYSWYANQSTTLVKGETYILNVRVGIVVGSDDESYSGDDIRVYIDYNQDGIFQNNATERIVNLVNNGGTGSYTFTVPAGILAGSYRMRIQLMYYSGSGSPSDPNGACDQTFRDGETEDYTLTIIDPCTPIVSNFSFYPNNGTEGTEVKITKVTTASTGNFSIVTGVLFNNIPAASFRIEDDNTIYAIVPNGAGTGRITLIESTPCKRNSTSNFTYELNTGTCNNYSELFISEVYDPTSGNNHYIEIFNGTENAINLDIPNNYTLRVVNKSSLTDPNPTINTINITGVIRPGQVRVYYAGSNGGLATGSQASAGSGFNAYDEIQLVKNGTIIDLVQGHTAVGYDFRRLNSAVAPAATYASGDWNRITSGISTSDLGSFIPLLPLSIITQPVDVNGCSISMTTLATGSGTLTYQWYYNNNRANETGWTALIDGTSQFPNVTISGATGTNLLINGDLGPLNNYQFYCVASNATCSEYSNAAQFIATPEPYFRSNGSGDWKLASTWQMSPNGLPGTWVDACTYPWDTNSVSVTILNTHHINVIEVSAVTPDVQIDQLIIDEGGTLELEPNAEIWFSDGPGADITVNGTFYDRSTASPNGIDFLTGATWQMGNNGTIIKTGTSTVNKYRDNYEGGISGIPATAHWIYRREINNIVSVSSTGMFYPNLYFENTSGSAGTYTFSGSTGGFTTVKGNMILRGDYSTTVLDTNTNTTPMRVLGDIEISTLNTLRTHTTTSVAGTGIEVAGNIVNNGTIVINKDSSFLRLNGTGTQNISGTGTFDLGRLETVKPAQTKVNLLTNLEVKDRLRFNGGIIQTNSNILNVSNKHPLNSIIGFDLPNGTGVYSNDNYVYGSLRRAIDSLNIYVFPVGDIETGLGYNPSRLTIRSVPAGTPYATGQFVASWPGTINTRRYIDCGGSTKFIEYTGLTNLGYWQFGGSTFNNYDINIHPNVANVNIMPNEYSALGHHNNYRALKENNSQAGTVWNPNVSVAGNPCIVSYNYYDIIGAGYSGFSIFAPGGGNGNTTALPIELLYFNISCTQPKPVIQWATASEMNTAYFTIEKSEDGISYTPLTHMDAAGNSSKKIEYSYSVSTDDLTSYYRLVEVDLDGNIYYHGIIHNGCKTISSDKNKVYYQPNNGIVIQFGSRIPEAVHVYDATGRLMVSDKITGSQSIHNIYNATNWAQAVYFVTLLYSDNDIETEKVVVY